MLNNEQLLLVQTILFLKVDRRGSVIKTFYLALLRYFFFYPYYIPQLIFFQLQHCFYTSYVEKAFKN